MFTIKFYCEPSSRSVQLILLEITWRWDVYCESYFNDM